MADLDTLGLGLWLGPEWSQIWAPSMDLFE